MVTEITYNTVRSRSKCVTEYDEDTNMAKMSHKDRVQIEQRWENLDREEREKKSISYPIRKSNEMIQRSRYSLTLREQRLLLFLISKIQRSDKGDKRYTIKIRDACRVCGIDADDKEIGGTIYKAVYDAFGALRNKGFTIYPETGGRVICAWIEHPHQDENGDMTFNFDPYIVKYLFDVQKRFTQYRLQAVLRMKSTYGIRLYELLKSYVNIGSKRFALEDLRQLLDADTPSYAKYSFFKMRVLEPAMQDLARSDIKVDYIEIKTGRKVVGIEFIMTDIHLTAEERLRLEKEYNAPDAL